MKIVLNILCWVLTVFCCWFPFAYFHSDFDKKEIKISHILTDSKEQIENVQNLLKEGKSFEQLAQDYSKDETKTDKGNIGYQSRGNLVEEFENAAFALDLNKISEPVKTEYGWHLIKVYDIKYFSDKENFGKKYFVY